MSRRPAIFTETDIIRIFKAAKKANTGPVQILTDGSILIHMESVETPIAGAGNVTETGVEILDL